MSQQRFEVELFDNEQPGCYAIWAHIGGFWDLNTKEPIQAAAEYFLKKGASANDLLIVRAGKVKFDLKLGVARGVPLACLAPALQERRDNEARFGDWRPIRVPRVTELTERLLPDNDEGRRIARLYCDVERFAPSYKGTYKGNSYECGGRTVRQRKDGSFAPSGHSFASRMARQHRKEDRRVLKEHKASAQELDIAANDRGRNSDIGCNTGKTPAEQRADRLRAELSPSLRRSEISTLAEQWAELIRKGPKETKDA